jgi:hypothetical protein
VFELIQLIPQRRVDARVAVAEQVDPPGTDAVEKAPARIVVQPQALASIYVDQWYVVVSGIVLLYDVF